MNLHICIWKEYGRKISENITIVISLHEYISASGIVWIVWRNIKKGWITLITLSTYFVKFVKQTCLT